MSTSRLNRIAGVLPLIFSALAAMLVAANVLEGVPPSIDEDSSAHVWQLLIGLQLPLVLLFVSTADWKRRSPFILVAAQMLAIVVACVPVWLAGY